MTAQDVCGTLDGQLLLSAGALGQGPHSTWRVPVAGEVPELCLCCDKGFFAVVTSVSPWEEPLGAPAFGCGHSLVDGDEGQLPWLKGIVSSLVYFN